VPIITTPSRAVATATIASVSAGAGRAVAVSGAPVVAETEVAMFVLIVTSDAVVHYYRMDTSRGGECKLEKVSSTKPVLDSSVHRVCPLGRWTGTQVV
jgi:hypothetical protein